MAGDAPQLRDGFPVKKLYHLTILTNHKVKQRLKRDKPINFFDDDDTAHVAKDQMVPRYNHVSDIAVYQLPRQMLPIH